MVFLIAPSSVETFSRALYQQKQDYQNYYPIRIWSHIDYILPDPLVQVIQSIGHVTIVIDHKATEELYLLFQKAIVNQCGQRIVLHYLLPQYHLVSSILPEYIYEESQFDEIAMNNFLSHIIS